MKRQTHNLDASDRPLGRLAVEIAILLRSKHKPGFMPHKDEGDFVVVDNINKMKITGGKMQTKIYRHHTGHPGGFREMTMEKFIEKKGLPEVLKKAVYGMMPKNRLRPRQIKRLKIK